MTASAPPAGASSTGAGPTAWYALSPDEALAAQGVTVDAGLTSAEADARRAKVEQVATGLSVLTILLATELGFLQNFLKTVSLTGEQWLVCIGVALSLIVVEEVKKLLKVRTGDEPATAPVAAPAAA